jgi:hypothetical protein
LYSNTPPHVQTPPRLHTWNIGVGCNIHLYSNTPPHVQAPSGRIRGILEWVVIILINVSARMLETSTLIPY